MRHTLLERCGDTWYQNFRADRFKINESIPTKVPRLLPDDMIEAVKTRLQQNKTIFHGQYRNKYLLGRMTLCHHCNKALFGQTSRGKQYYRHTDCTHFTSIPAAFDEDSMPVHLFSFFGNQSAMEEAIQAAIPDYIELEKPETDQIEIKQELKKIKTGREHLLDLSLKYVIEDSDIKDKMTRLRERESLLNDQLAVINRKLANIPSAKSVGKKADLLKTHIESIYSSGAEFSEMDFDEKRKLVQLAFTGKDPDGTLPGVYIRKDGEGWTFEIKGVIPGTAIRDYLPMDPEKRTQYWGLNRMLNKSQLVVAIDHDNHPRKRSIEVTIIGVG